jgi:hypothetical protein
MIRARQKGRSPWRLRRRTGLNCRGAGRYDGEGGRELPQPLKIQALINSTEAQRRSKKITDAQADAIVSATVQIMTVRGCK